MTTDRELLELAAKAAGIEIADESPWNGYDNGLGFYRLNGDGSSIVWKWNPLDDDGDALRLAIKLKINIKFSDCHYSVNTRDVFDICCCYEHSDRSIDIRRAIVSTAAEIGRKK